MPMLSGGGKFLSPKNVKNGDVLTFKNAGDYQESKFVQPEKKADGSPNPKAGQPKMSLVFDVEVGKDPMIFTCNNTNQAICKDAWGRNTDDWVGKKATIAVIKVNVGGQLKDSIMLTPQAEVHSDIPPVEWEE